jgi:hypothetical protein
LTEPITVNIWRNYSDDRARIFSALIEEGRIGSSSFYIINCVRCNFVWITFYILHYTQPNKWNEINSQLFSLFASNRRKQIVNSQTTNLFLQRTHVFNYQWIYLSAVAWRMCGERVKIRMFFWQLPQWMRNILQQSSLNLLSDKSRSFNVRYTLAWHHKKFVSRI